MMKFICDCCGLCCRHISGIKLLQEFDMGNGICKFLDTATNRCRIYKMRPDICNVEIGYKKYFSKLYTEEEYIQLNYDACAYLKCIHKEDFNDNEN